jgi:hypothetical protein
MNLRIDKLIDDARLTAVAEMFEVELTKFAELIVQECINKIETHEIPVGSSAAGEIACEMTYSALKEIRDKIREHFGVEL